MGAPLPQQEPVRDDSEAVDRADWLHGDRYRHGLVADGCVPRLDLADEPKHADHRVDLDSGTRLGRSPRVVDQRHDLQLAAFIRRRSPWILRTDVLVAAAQGWERVQGSDCCVAPARHRTQLDAMSRASRTSALPFIRRLRQRCCSSSAASSCDIGRHHVCTGNRHAPRCDRS